MKKDDPSPTALESHRGSSLPRTPAEWRDELNQEEAAAYATQLGYRTTAARLREFALRASGPEHSRNGDNFFYAVDRLLKWLSTMIRTVPSSDEAVLGDEEAPEIRSK